MASLDLPTVMRWNPGTMHSTASSLISWGGKLTNLAGNFSAAGSMVWTDEAGKSAKSHANELKNDLTQLGQHFQTAGRAIASAADSVQTAQTIIRAAQHEASAHVGVTLTNDGHILFDMQSDNSLYPTASVDYSVNKDSLDSLAAKARNAVKDVEIADTSLNATLSGQLGERSGNFLRDMVERLIQVEVDNVHRFLAWTTDLSDTQITKMTDHLIATTGGLIWENTEGRLVDWGGQYVLDHQQDIAGFINNTNQQLESWYQDNKDAIAGRIQTGVDNFTSYYDDHRDTWIDDMQQTGAYAAQGVQWLQQQGSNVEEQFNNWTEAHPTLTHAAATAGNFLGDQAGNIWGTEANLATSATHNVQNFVTDLNNSAVGDEVRDTGHQLHNLATTAANSQTVHTVENLYNDHVGSVVTQVANGPVGDAVDNTVDTVQNIYNDAANGAIGDSVRHAGNEAQKVWDDTSGAVADGWNSVFGH